MMFVTSRIMRNLYLQLCLGFVFVGFVSCTVAMSSGKTAASRPNIVFILIDDLGIEATNSYGSQGLVRKSGELVPYKQPNLDAIAAAGMTFRNAYATPSCAPTRAQFLTGRYPFRTGVTYPLLPNGPLADTEITFAEILQEKGYLTGMAGKWNLRHGIGAARATPAQLQEVEAHVQSQGFAQCYPFVGHTIDYGPAKPEAEYLPYKTNRWACDFVSKAAGGKEPFFLQYSLGLVHSPFVPTPLGDSGTVLGADAGRAERAARQELHYLSMLEYADGLIGRLLQRIDALGITKDTIIIVAGDNGTARQFTSRYQGKDVQGGKLTYKDSSSRVPFYGSPKAVVGQEA